MTKPRRLLRRKAVLERSGKTVSSLDRDIKMGLFPKPVRIGPRSVAWFEDEIIAWQDRCSAARRLGQDKIKRDVPAT